MDKEMSLTLGKTHITEARLYYSFITKAATGFYQERQRRGPLPKLDPDPVQWGEGGHVKFHVVVPAWQHLPPFSLTGPGWPAVLGSQSRRSCGAGSW